MNTATSHASGCAIRPWFAKCFGLAILAALAGWSLALAQDVSGAHEVEHLSATASGQVIAALPHPRRANFEREVASPEVRQLADWIVDSDDSPAMPFVLIDKKNARVYVFHVDGRLRGTAPALLGLAVGDDSVPGIGQRKLSHIRPQERTTPAGRFVAWLDHNLNGREILWVDYQGALSLHPVVTGTLQEQRAQRLATPTPLDNRISYGCINVPVDFFKTVVKPAFASSNGMVYVLPETRTAQQVFSSYDIDAPAMAQPVQQNLGTQAAPQTDTSPPAR